MLCKNTVGRDCFFVSVLKLGNIKINIKTTIYMERIGRLLLTVVTPIFCLQSLLALSYTELNLEIVN